MADISSLLQRIDAEFTNVEAQLKSYQAEQVHEYEARKQRLAQLESVFEKLRGVWRPRLEALAVKFGDRVKVTPKFSPSAKEAQFAFQSKLAHIVLRFSATTDSDVRKVILAYDLDILPIFVRYEPHAETEFPLDNVDLDAAGKWIDDQIVAFVKTYLSLHQNDLYLKDLMVEDPVAGVRFPKFAAAATLEADGKTYYFIGEATKKEFEAKRAK
jgi:YHS domain-containing protein